MEITQTKNKILYPIHCKKCKEYISSIEISIDLWNRMDEKKLGVDEIKCNNCINK